MRKPSVSQLVYRALYPNRGSDDPGSFAVHIGRYIVPELRVEVFNFYGNFEEIEAKYPGLDYSHPSHRLRLGRFPHHRQLFQAFDALGLTKDEMYWLCSWEGTKLARDRFEKDQGIKVVDTTGNDIKLASPSKPQMVEVHESPDEDFGRSCPVRPLSDDDASCDAIAMAADSEHCFSVDNPVNGCYITAHSRDRRKEDEEGSEDELAHALVNQISTLQNSTASNSDPFGFSLNQRLMAANAARVSGQHRLPLDAAYEQWLKEEIERDDPFSQHMRPELLRQSASSAAASSSNDDCLPALSEQRDTDAATARTRTSTPFTSTSDSVTSSAIDLTIDRRVRREAQAIADRRREELLRLNGADRQTFPFIAPSQTISAATTPRASDSNPPSSSSISATTLWAQYEPDISRYGTTTASSNPSLHFSLSEQLQQSHDRAQRQRQEHFRQHLIQRHRQQQQQQHHHHHHHRHFLLMPSHLQETEYHREQRQRDASARYTRSDSIRGGGQSHNGASSSEP